MKTPAKWNIVSSIGTKLYKSGLAFLLSIIIFTGCGKPDTRTLILCKETQTETYAYDCDGNIYRIVDGASVPIRSVGLVTRPALSIINNDSNYTFVKISQGKYSGTIESVSAYITYLESQSFAYTLVERSADYLECYLENNTTSVRIIYTSDDVVHIYGKDKSGNYCTPPYLSGKGE